ncbi:MAG: IS66 family insertion sequence element accessory protein TnpB [Acidobacteriota bacterium]|nr:IS66 family insertion sequence element accessory protein TnpB [Acidobacteriota bacterium]
MTNTTELTTAEPLLRTDALGRVRTPVERREMLLDEFEKSGVSGKKFAAMTGVGYQTFASWIQKRRRARGDYQKMRDGGAAGCPKKLQWVEAVLGGGGGKPGGKVLRLELPGGVRLEIADEEQAILAGKLIREIGR